MSKITVLDQMTINQIAAGEVIERPSSVVKELTENALDAGATAVTVEIRDGGLSLIRITDNGEGIPAEEIPTAFLRHSTSKIRKAEDLLTISSLGFRGEALSSIASVAQVELITRTPESLTGMRYRIEGGEEKELEEIGAPQGTTFLVRNLFYNTPARRKFLKTPTTEASYISNLLEHLALSHPEVSFRLLINNQVKLHTSGNTNLKDIIYTIYGRDITQALIPIAHESEDIRIQGFAGKPEINRGNRTFETYFVNGRYVRSAIITKALENAYRGFVMQHKYPFAVFHLQITSSWLDVNVHPTKMELRFRNEEEVYQAVYQAVRDALTGKELIPTGTFRDKEDGQKAEKEKQHERGAEPFETRRIADDVRRGTGNGNSHMVQAVREKVNYEPFTIEKMQQNIRNSRIGNQQVMGRGSTNVREEQKKNSMATAAGLYSSAGSFPKKTGDEAKRPSLMTASIMEEIIGSAEKENREGNNAQKVQEADSRREDLPISDSTEMVPEEEAFASAETDSESSVPESEDSGESDEIIPEDDEARETFAPQILSVPEAENPKQLDLFEERILAPSARSEYRLIGQLFDTYWLIQYRDKFLIMDQHAAHEKVLYEKTMRRIRNQEYLKQQVQPPIILTLNAVQRQAVEEYREYLEHFGFQIEPFGGREYAVYAVPANMFGIERQDALIEMIDSLSDDSAHTETDLIEDKIATMSCKAAVKGNNRLSFEEAEALIDELMTLDNPYMCPHGRPTIITMTQYELEKKFKRVVS